MQSTTRYEPFPTLTHQGSSRRETDPKLIEHYERVAEYLIPYLRNRPLHLNRFPDGIYGESFYQKNTPAHYPEWIPTETIESSGKGKAIRYTLCQEVSTLLRAEICRGRPELAE